MDRPNVRVALDGHAMGEHEMTVTRIRYQIPSDHANNETGLALNDEVFVSLEQSTDATELVHKIGYKVISIHNLELTLLSELADELQAAGRLK
jgi:hypothetical protein